jgi:hypothetical protein
MLKETIHSTLFETEEMSFLSARDNGSLDSLEYFSMDEEIVEYE